MFNPPTLEDLQETRRANEKLVLEALDSKPEWVETELAKTTGLALSHLRAALASLLDQGRVRRLPGTGTRAVYGLADPGLADVPATPLTEDAVRIREYLEGRADSALYMSDQLRLTREEVMAALSLLNAHGMITCTFVGSLVIFRLKEQQALDAEAAEAAAEAGAGAGAVEGTKAPAKKPARAAKKAKAEADPAEPAPEVSASAPAKKPASKAAKAVASADADPLTEDVPSVEVGTDQPAKAAKKSSGKAADQQGDEPAEKPVKKPAAKKAAPAQAAAEPDTGAQGPASQETGAQGAAAAEVKKPAVRKRVKKPVS